MVNKSNNDDNKTSNALFDIAGLLFMIGGVTVINPLMFTPLFIVGVIIYIGFSPLMILGLVSFFSVFYFSGRS
jgi:hypothetical protein